MEYIRGGELFDRLIAHKLFSPPDAAGVMFHICAALSYLHENKARARGAASNLETFPVSLLGLWEVALSEELPSFCRQTPRKWGEKWAQLPLTGHPAMHFWRYVLRCRQVIHRDLKPENILLMHPDTVPEGVRLGRWHCVATLWSLSNQRNFKGFPRASSRHEER